VTTALHGPQRAFGLGLTGIRPALHCLLYSPTRQDAVEVALGAPSPNAAYRLWQKSVWCITIRAMAGKTVNREHLSQALYQKVGLSRVESAALVELVLKEMTDCLERGEAVKLSSFGSFVVRKKAQRMGRNPKTGEKALISPRRIVMFKPSDILKQRINASRSPSIGAPDPPSSDLNISEELASRKKRTPS
jgi:integration host factor subunit alpha